MRPSAALPTAAILIGALAVARAAHVDQQSRDSAGAGDPGAALIAGAVVTDAAGKPPARRAVLILTGESVPDGRIAIAGDDGHFSFTGLRSGSYTLSVSKAGYVPTFVGSPRPGRGPGAPISLAPAQHLDDLTVVLWRGAVVSGRVLDHLGRPQRAAVISAIDVAGGPFGSATATARTNGRGEYRVFGLPPGKYRVVVQPGFNFNGAESPSDGRNSAPMHVTYAPTYYPGTVDPGLAAAIELRAAEERPGLDMSLQLVASAKLDGQVVGPDGKVPQGVELGLLFPGQEVGLVEKSYAGTSPMNATLTARDGRFSRPSLVPGHYVVFARTAQGLWGATPFDVAGHDITGLLVTLQPGVTVKGRVTFDGARGVPVDPSGFQVILEPTSSTALPAHSLSARTAANGDFSITGIVPGDYWVTATAPGSASGWALDSVSLGPNPIATAIHIDTPMAAEPVNVTFTDHPTTIAGRLMDSLGRPVHEYLVVAFPATRDSWLPGSPRIRQVRPSTTGQFSFAGIPPGDYFVAAVTSVNPGDLADPLFLEALIPGAVRLSIAGHEVKTLDLRFSR